MAFCACSPGPRAERVVLVTIDTLRADHVGAYGRDPSPTPALDLLSAEGTRFDAAFSPAPLTLPSHATLLTGRDPHEHGVRHNGSFRLPADVPTLAEAVSARGFGTAAFVGAYVLDRTFGLGRGFDVYDDQMTIHASASGASQVAERPADLVVDAALAWLAEAPDRYFLWVHLYDPHAEYRPPRPFRSRFESRYDGEIAFADAQVARLRERIDTRWPDGKTLWAVTSDHGESLGEHGEATHAYSLYDATQRVPLILAGPGVPAGRVVSSVVSLRDVAPTLSALAGARGLRGATGTSLLPLLENEPGAADARTEADTATYLETVAPQLDWRWSPLLGVRTATHKYIRAPRPELYDVREDPDETTDLAGAEPERVAELDALLEARLASGRAPSVAAPLDDAARARLEALGYVASRATSPDAVEIGRVGGVDPKDELELVTKLQRANQLLGKQQSQRALAELLTLGNRGLEVAVLRTVAAVGAGDLETARSSAEEAAALAPESELGWVLLGRVAEAEGDLEGARAHYLHARSLDTGAGSPETGLGRIAEARGDKAAAETHYRAALETRLPDPDAQWRLAVLLLERGKIAASTAQLSVLPRQILERPDAAARLARALQDAGQTRESTKRLVAALRRQPRSVTLLRARGDLLDEQGRPDAALAARRKAFEVAPEQPDVRNELAWALARRGVDLERAESLARGGLVDAPGDGGAVDTLCAVLLAQGEPQEALTLAEPAIARADGANLAFLHYRRAEALHMLGRSEEATKALASAHSAADGKPDYYLEELGKRLTALLEVTSSS